MWPGVIQKEGEEDSDSPAEDALKHYRDDFDAEVEFARQVLPASLFTHAVLVSSLSSFFIFIGRRRHCPFSCFFYSFLFFMSRVVRV
jgi:hypothetical protein